jgi:hypothetical protein
MKSGSYKCYSTSKKGPIDPMVHFTARLGRVDSILKFFKEMNPSELNVFISKLKANFQEAVGHYKFNTNSFDWEQIRENLSLIQNFPELEKVVFLFICKTLQLPKDYLPNMGEIELLFYDRMKVGEHVSYYCVKTFVDIYGREEGTEIYKQIVPKLLREMKEKSKQEQPENPKEVTIHDMHKRNLEGWCNSGLADFSYHIFDDYKVLYRFDKCLIPEVLKEFNDPDLAYLASCYIGDNPEWKKGRIIHMRRTQTLQHADFCDELYWNNSIHPNVEQPPLEFTENIGKE